MSAESVSSQARAVTEVPAASSLKREALIYCMRRGEGERRGSGWGSGERSLGSWRSSRGHPEKLGERRREGERAPERQGPGAAREAPAELGAGSGVSPRILRLRLLF